MKADGSMEVDEELDNLGVPAVERKLRESFINYKAYYPTVLPMTPPLGEIAYVDYDEPQAVPVPVDLAVAEVGWGTSA